MPKNHDFRVVYQKETVKTFPNIAEAEAFAKTVNGKVQKKGWSAETK